MKADSTYLIIGKIGATHGVRGWLKVYSYTEERNDIFTYQPWYLRPHHSTAWRPVHLEDKRTEGNILLIKFAEINAPETARLLTNDLIGTPRAHVAPLKEGEYYWSDLIGLTVIDRHGQCLGKVTTLLETGSNDVLIVKGEKEIAIPFLMDDVIKRIDLEKQQIHVDWEWH